MIVCSLDLASAGRTELVVLPAANPLVVLPAVSMLLTTEPTGGTATTGWLGPVITLTVAPAMLSQALHWCYNRWLGPVASRKDRSYRRWAAQPGAAPGQ